jgi:hypothetical protein
MKAIYCFLMFLVSGYIISIIMKYNFLGGLLILLVWVCYFVWSFYKKNALFEKDDKISKFLILFFAKLIGFNLGFFKYKEISIFQNGVNHKLFLFILLRKIIA